MRTTPNGNGVYISAADVSAFNAQWPCSPIVVRPHFAEFDRSGNLVDCDFTEDEDGSAALALIEDAQEWLLSR